MILLLRSLVNVLNIGPVTKSETLSELITGETSVKIVKSGHQPILEDTPSVAAAVNKFLQVVDSSK